MKEDAYLGIIKMEEFFKSLNMPTRLEDVNINSSELDLFVNHLTKRKSMIVDVVSLNKEDMYEIFKLMFKEV